MTEYLLYALGIYAVLVLATYFIDIDGWLWRALAIVIGVIAVGFGQGWDICYLGIGVGGLSVLTLRLEDLMMLKGDEAKRNILTPRQRPPY